MAECVNYKINSSNWTYNLWQNMSLNVDLTIYGMQVWCFSGQLFSTTIFGFNVGAVWPPVLGIWSAQLFSNFSYTFSKICLEWCMT